MQKKQKDINFFTFNIKIWKLKRKKMLTRGFKLLRFYSTSSKILSLENFDSKISILTFTNPAKRNPLSHDLLIEINDSGQRAASPYTGVTYWTYNWRKDGGGARMYELAKEEKFYKQEYCGCIYSLRDTNNWRKQNDRQEIAIGEEFYSAKISSS